MIRDGEPAAEVIRLAGETRAEAVFIADDVSRYATRGATFRRMWNLYLAYSETGFRAGYLDVHQLLLERDW